MQAQFFYLAVDIRIFFYINVFAWNVGFRLVIIVIAYKELDCIFRKELFEFAIKLGSKSFIMGKKAMVKVFPEPVTPSRVWYLSSFCKPSTSSAIACG
jgi:hypothetical protein